MNTFLWFLLTLLIAYIFGTIAMKIKVPAGGMIGAMVGVALLNLLTGQAYMYSILRTAVQICLGTMSGYRVGRSELKKMGALVVPIIVMLLICLILNVVFGVVIVKTTSLDIATALLAITPGGATDMVFVAADIGADTGMVGLLQSLRMIYCNGVLPIFFVAVINRKKQREGEPEKREEYAPATSDTLSRDPGKRGAMFAVAACGGLLFKKLGVPGGTLVGALIFTVAFTCIFGKTEYPAPMKRYQQMLSGAYIGTSITYATVSAIPSMLFAVVVILVDIMVYVFLMSFVLGKVSKMDHGTRMLCSTPGGIGEATILSEELGTDTATVAAMNTVRMILVVATFPTIIAWLTGLLNR